VKWNPPPPVREEPLTQEEISPQLDFLYRAENNFMYWVQFADAKAGGVILVLSIGALDVFHNTKNFIHARHLAHPLWGWICLIAFVVSVLAMAMTVAGVGRTLFPKQVPSRPSDFFFGVAARYRTSEEYGEAVSQKVERDLIDHVSLQAWNLARIAATKYAHLRYAYLGAALFLVAWAIARASLSFAS
jgi:pycsar effector protein